MQNSPARSSIDVGSVIADTYTIEALIGRGGMGAVFLASHKRLPGKQVAIKVLHADMSGEEVLARFRREAEIASRLGHPNIVQVHDFNLMPDGTPYLVLEYLRGESLAQRLRNGPLPHDQMVSIVRQIGSALAAAHREGIVHRDLKPQNLFLVPTEVDGRVVEIAKVLDFGISKIRGSTTVKTQDSALLGTPQYMAPEQATGQHKLVDERTDVFALGAIVYEMLTGHPAFSGETIPEVVFKVVYEQPAPLVQQPEAIITAVQRAMAKSQADRYANVGDFVEALTGTPLPVGRPGPSIPPPDVGFAAGSRAPNTGKDAGKDAFAQTMDSGDHGSAATQLPPSQVPPSRVPPSQVPPSQVPTPQPASQEPSSAASVRGSAPTLDSQNQALGAGTASVPATPTASRRKGPLLAVVVLAVAAIAGAAVVMATRDRGAQPSDPSEPPAAKHEPPIAEQAAMPDDANSNAANANAANANANAANANAANANAADAANANAANANAANANAANAANANAHGAADATDTAAEAPARVEIAGATKPAVDAARPASDAKKPPKDDSKPKPPVAADDDTADEGDEMVATQLRDAETALAASDWNRAETLANSVSSSEGATARQKLRAAVVFGTVQCLARNDEGRARIALRKLAAVPKLRRKLLDACHANNYLMNVR